MMELTGNRMDAIGVVRLLRQEIEAGAYRLGDRLPAERQLAARFSVSRGTVRRALSELELAGLVRVRRGSGAYVASEPGGNVDPVLENARPLELMDVRFALEPHTCRLAVLNAVRADFDDLERLLDAMKERAGDAVEFAELDASFHARLAETTRNPLLIWITTRVNSVRAQTEWVRMRQQTLNNSIIETYNRQHGAICDAIRSREPEIAAGLMKEHLETARLSLTRASAT